MSTAVVVHFYMQIDVYLEKYFLVQVSTGALKDKLIMFTMLSNA